jgi:alkylation response protein AidB-like acyl-CoA dehydrogenase
MLNHTEEQTIISDSAARFVDDKFPFSVRQQIASTDHGYDISRWQDFAELGWLGIPVPEVFGGIGGSIVDVSLIQQQLGRALVRSPFLATVGGASTALMLAGNENQKTHYLGLIASGKCIVSCALFETESNTGPRLLGDIPSVETVATADEDFMVVNGCKRLVPWGLQAHSVIISANIESETVLLLVPSDADGVRKRPYRMHDASRCADMEFSDVRVHRDQVLENSSAAAIRRIIDTETALLCMEASAVMWAIHDQTLEYMKTREQFGQTLGAMQSLQHRIVDVYVKCQLAKSMAEDAIIAVSGTEYTDSEAGRVSAAKAFIGENGRSVGKEGIQLHGGIGMTNDIPIGHYFKRLVAIDRLNGDASWHRSRFRSLTDAR